MKNTPSQWQRTPADPYTILIIEDDDDFRVFISDLLDASGFTIVQARDGEEGLSIFSTQPADLVITDIVMPGIDGLEVIQRIKLIDPYVPMVAMAATLDKPHKQGFLSLAIMKGADAVLGKPFKIKELRTTINRLLDKRPSSQPQSREDKL